MGNDGEKSQDRDEIDLYTDARGLWEDSSPRVRGGQESKSHYKPVIDETLELADPERQHVRPSLPLDSERAEVDRSIRSDGRDTRAIPVWSRSGESGWVYIRLLVTVLATAIMAWMFGSWQTIHISAWICLAGVIAGLLLGYPLIVGLERPIRMSPERAVRDFFESLEHHGPLYKRMWLLLAPEGRSGRNYQGFEGFRLYWKQRIGEWRHRGGAWPLTPVVAVIEKVDVKTNTEDETEREINFTLKISLRGKRSAGPVAQYDLKWSVVRGPDRQWYLNQGELPG